MTAIVTGAIENERCTAPANPFLSGEIKFEKGMNPANIVPIARMISGIFMLIDPSECEWCCAFGKPCATAKAEGGTRSAAEGVVNRESGVLFQKIEKYRRNI